jgi:secondary thiamine-phosphate synthase enzyme
MVIAGEIPVTTGKRLEMVDLTSRLQQEVAGSGVDEGIVVLYNPHTTAGLLINEGADPDVQRDILGALSQIIPADYPYRHSEGNSPAHLMTAVTATSVTVILHQKRLQLGTWQRIFFCEFDGPRNRKVWWKILAG